MIFHQYGLQAGNPPASPAARSVGSLLDRRSVGLAGCRRTIGIGPQLSVAHLAYEFNYRSNDRASSDRLGRRGSGDPSRHPRFYSLAPGPGSYWLSGLIDPSAQPCPYGTNRPPVGRPDTGRCAAQVVVTHVMADRSPTIGCVARTPVRVGSELQLAWITRTAPTRWLYGRRKSS